MLPVFVAGAVIVSASCFAWYYNDKTEDERRRQEEALEEREKIYANYCTASQNESERAREYQKQQVRQWYNDLLRAIDLHEKKINPIRESLNTLFKLMQSEISNDATSPYRKSALKREFTRIEDANLRLEQYGLYLAFEKRTVNQLWKNAQ